MADKFSLVKEIYQRPTVVQAFSECIKDYIKHHEFRGGATPEWLVSTARKDLAKEKKDMKST